MSKISILIFALVGLVAADNDLHAKWKSFKDEHFKDYQAHEEPRRFEAFAENLRQIEEHNEKYRRGEVTFEVGLNAHSDLTKEEFRQTKLSAYPYDHAFRIIINGTDDVLVSNVTYIDWRTRGAVSSIKNQGRCNAGYAFAAIASIESRLMIDGEPESDFSEQDIMDCTYLNGSAYNNHNNYGCYYGDAPFTMSQIMERGLAKECDYVYVSGLTNNITKCRENVTRRKFDKYELVKVRNDEYFYANALMKGPIAVMLDASQDSFRNYKNGTYNTYDCDESVNHAVLLVGFERVGLFEYWILKNSWGPSWGEGGYMRLRKGTNLCSIADFDAFYMKKKPKKGGTS